MGNCLVTKLKGVVDNNNLPELGYFKYKLIRYGNQHTDKLCVVCAIRSQGHNTTSYFVGDGGLSAYEELSSTLNTELSISKYTNNVYAGLRSGDGYIKVKKELIGQIWSSYVNASSCDKFLIPVEEIQYLTNLTDVEATFMLKGNINEMKGLPSLVNFKCNACYDNVYGDLKSFSNFPQIQKIIISSTNIKGDINDISNLINLNQLEVKYNIEITGELKTFLDNLYMNGKTSGSLDVNVGLSGVKYNGESSQYDVWHVTFGSQYPNGHTETNSPT